jgi:hypothetical protein
VQQLFQNIKSWGFKRGYKNAISDIAKEHNIGEQTVRDAYDEYKKKQFGVKNWLINYP